MLTHITPSSKAAQKTKRVETESKLIRSNAFGESVAPRKAAVRFLQDIPLEDCPNAIRGLRVMHNVSAADLARIIDCPPPQITRGEISGVGIGKRLWKLIAEHFGVETWELHDPLLARKLSEKVSEPKPRKNTRTPLTNR